MEFDPRRCGQCSLYLSCAPLKVLEDGNTICGRCTATISFRNKALEAMLQNEEFPCMFENYGCKEENLFDVIRKHENGCKFKPLLCRIDPSTCQWKGNINDIMKHVLEEHPQNVLNDGKFVINLDILQPRESTRTVAYQESDVWIILNYNLDLHKEEFSYKIYYISDNNSDVSFYVILSNPSNKTLKLLLEHQKSEMCCQGDDQFDKIISIDNMLAVSGTVNLLVISIAIDIPLKPELLRKLECVFCGIYITQPIFKIESGPVCCFCAEKHKLKSVEDDDLEKIMLRIYYPCRWKFCSVKEKYSKIRQHEEVCNHRETVCPVKTCFKTFNLQNEDNIHYHFKIRHPNFKRIESNSATFYFKNRCSTVIFQFYFIANDQLFVIECKKDYNHNLHYTVFPDLKKNVVTVCLKCPCKKISKNISLNEVIDVKSLDDCEVKNTNPHSFFNNQDVIITIEDNIQKENVTPTICNVLP